MNSGDYNATAGIWGFKLSQNVTVSANSTITLTLTPGYYDEFSLDYGWEKQDSASSGAWVRDIPIETTDQNTNAISNTGKDSDQDNNEECYITGNGGGQAGSDDVDNGFVRLTSPAMNLASWGGAKLTYQFWFYNGGGNGTAPNDKLEVTVSNGTEKETIAGHDFYFRKLLGQLLGSAIGRAIVHDDDPKVRPGLLAQRQQAVAGVFPAVENGDNDVQHGEKQGERVSE